MERSHKLILGGLIVAAIVLAVQPGRVFDLVADDPVAYAINGLLILLILWFLRWRRNVGTGTHRASSPLPKREPAPGDERPLSGLPRTRE